MDDLVKVARALADPTRVRILVALLNGELCVCELCDSLQVTQSTLSTHLQVIREANLVTARKAGKWMYYAIQPGARELIEGLFKAFEPSLRKDATLCRDARQLGRRLTLRTNGSCCVGLGAHRRPGTKRSRA